METLGVIIIAVIGLFLLYKGYVINQSHKQAYQKPEGVKEWHDIKYGNGFIVLHWTELEKWDLASVKEKCELINYQQKLIKEGLIKIVKEDGERRLITNHNFKQVNDRKAKN